MESFLTIADCAAGDWDSCGDVGVNTEDELRKADDDDLQEYIERSEFAHVSTLLDLEAKKSAFRFRLSDIML